MNTHMQLTEAEGRSLERLARRYSLTTMEIMIAMGEIIRMEFNAEHNQGRSGEAFKFTRNHAIGLDYFARANVPKPDAVVDLFEARERCLTDAHYADVLLDAHRSRDLARDVLANTLAWAQFWAVRSPTPEGRAQYRAVVEELDGKPRLRVVGGLS